MLPFTLTPAFLASPDLGEFDSNSLECQPVSRVPELFAFGAMGILAASSLVATFRLRVARVQVNTRNIHPLKKTLCENCLITSADRVSCTAQCFCNGSFFRGGIL